MSSWAQNELRGKIPQQLHQKKNQAAKNHTGGRSGGAIDPSSTANSLALALERQANNLGGGTTGETLQGGTDPYQQLQQQLFQRMNEINIPATPLDELRKLASEQVNSQFDPMIAALQNQMNTHTHRAHESQHTAHDMYGALSKDMLAQIPELTQRFQAMDQATNQRYDQAQQMLHDQYAQQSNNQDAILRRLGVQAAQQPASQQQQDDQKYFQNALELAQQQGLNSLDQQQNAATDYQQALGSNAKFAGQNRVDAIGNALSDYLTQAEGQMTGLQGQKSQAMAALLAQMQHQDAQRVAQQTQQARDNLMKMFQFQLDATKAGNSAHNNQLFKGMTSLAGAANYLAQENPNSPIMNQNLMEHIQSVLQNPDVENGKFVLTPADPSTGKGATYAKMTPERMMKLLRDSFANDPNRQSYTTADINDAVNALMAYMGKMR